MHAKLKLCFIRGDARAADPVRRLVFVVKNLDVFWMRFERFSPRYGGFGAIFSGQHHQHNWAFVSHLSTSQYILGFVGVMDPHICGVIREIGAQISLMMLMMLTCWGLLEP